MKRMKQWLPLGLTCLVVLAAVLLPQKISRTRDAQLLGQVHAEELTVEGGLPSRSASLEARLTLLGMWSRDESAAAYLIQELLRNAESLQEDGASSLEAVLSPAANGLAETGILPEGFPLEDMTLKGGERILLRSQSSGLSASYLNLWCVLGDDSGGYLNILLDEDTAAVCGLHMAWPGAFQYQPSPVEVGDAFFRVLGVKAELLGGGKWEALFLLPDCALQYMVSFGPDTLDITSSYFQNGASVREDSGG